MNSQHWILKLKMRGNLTLFSQLTVAFGKILVALTRKCNPGNQTPSMNDASGLSLAPEYYQQLIDFLR